MILFKEQSLSPRLSALPQKSSGVWTLWEQKRQRCQSEASLGLPLASPPHSTGSSFSRLFPDHGCREGIKEKQVINTRRGAVVQRREWEDQGRNGSKTRIHPRKSPMCPRGFALKAKLSDAEENNPQKCKSSSSAASILKESL